MAGLLSSGDVTTLKIILKKDLLLTAAAVASVVILSSDVVRAASDKYDFVSLFSSNTALSQFGVTVPSLNNLGVAAYVRTANHTPTLFRHDGTVETIVAAGAVVSGARHADINDNGAIVVGKDSGQLNRFNPDGTVTLLATADGTGLADYAYFDGVFPSINNSGQVAALVATNDETPPTGADDSQIRRFGGASDPLVGGTLIDTVGNPLNPGDTRFSFGDPDINDAGVVAYKAQEASPKFVSVFSGDGTGTPTAAADLSVLNGNSGSEASINNSGAVAAGQAGGVLTTPGGVVNIIDDGTTGNFQSTGRVAFNNCNHVVFEAVVRETGEQGLFTGADEVNNKVLQAGDSVLGGTVREIRFFRDGFNDRGQIVFLMQTETAQQQNVSHVVLATPKRSLDVDCNGTAEALTDGILVLRFLFGFTSGSLIGDNVVGPSCTRCMAPEIEGYLQVMGLLLDADGNGQTDALTDGILVLRFLFQFTGEALVGGGAVAADCTRCAADEIEAFLQELLP